jgi:protein O-GlcNAc transferase
MATLTVLQAFELGLQHHRAGRLAEAEVCYRQILAVQPSQAGALHHLGIIAHQTGQHERAVEWIGQAIVLAPDNAAGYSNLGEACRMLDRLDEAVAAYRQAVQLAPHFAEARSNLGIALARQGRVEEAVGAWRQALALRPDYAEAHSNLLITLHYLPDSNPAEIFEEHRRWDERHARRYSTSVARQANDPDPNRRLRIGYVSPDFREHSVAYFLEGVLANHDRSQVETCCYADTWGKTR